VQTHHRRKIATIGKIPAQPLLRAVLDPGFPGTMHGHEQTLRKGFRGVKRLRRDSESDEASTRFAQGSPPQLSSAEEGSATLLARVRLLAPLPGADLVWSPTRVARYRSHTPGYHPRTPPACKRPARRERKRHRFFFVQRQRSGVQEASPEGAQSDTGFFSFNANASGVQEASPEGWQEISPGWSASDTGVFVQRQLHPGGVRG
jgi:hypothetical protein